ncbi:SH3 domain-containing protein [candidate division WOR-3 bacterium]|nr:SH3 domain-containing protein [candidate division WOR-3 bacterium]
MFLFYCFSLIFLGTTVHFQEYEKNRKDFDFSQVWQEPVPLAEISSEGLTRDYYGYLPSWVSNTSYQEFDFRLLTHIAYFSVELNTSGEVGSIPNQTRFNEIVSMAHPRGVKIHMTFTLFGTSSVSSFLNNSSARQTAISNIVNLVEDRGIEGANIDFEFVSSSVRDSFTLFIRQLSSALRTSSAGRKELYIAMPCVPSWYPGYNFTDLADTVDGLFIMAYDYHYSGSSTAGPVSPTVNSSFWGYYAVNTSIGDIINSWGTDRKKVILGMPYYGIEWPTTSQSAGSSTTGNGSAVTFNNAKSNAYTYGRIWDDNSQTPWYRYNDGSWRQCWYDDSVSIGLKLAIARDSALAGAGCWALGYDYGEDDLWNVIESTFWIGAPVLHCSFEVIASSLNLRAGPSSSYPVISQLHAGQKFVLFDRNGNWYKIYHPSASGAAHGWAYGGSGNPLKYLKGANGGDLLQVTASLLNVRSGPTTDSSVLTLISEGQCFVPDSYSGDWARIFLSDSNGQGWIHWQSYTRQIHFPEDSNAFFLTVDFFCCQDTVFSGDTFSLEVFTINTGESPLDSQLLLCSDSASPFYYPGSWTDSFNAVTEGFQALPSQYSNRNSLMRAPAVGSCQTIYQTFRFKRGQNPISSDFTFSVVVIPSSTVEEEINSISSNTVQASIQPLVFRELCFLEVDSDLEYELQVFDVSGRVVFAHRGDGRKIAFGNNLPCGSYFYLFRTVDDVQNPFILYGKMTKVIDD